ncbi:MAG: aldo/keto reductase [Firmicutes bacterium]|nr:aldo/keto reductase [Bacillota bacterium]
MQYLTLGKTAMKVSALGFGGIPIQRVDMPRAKAVLAECANQGMNFIDTARMYGDSEEKIGAFLEGNERSKWYIATKSMARDTESMAREVRTSLELMNCDYIDLYQFHNVASKEDLEKILAPGGAMEALEQAQAAGLVKHIGITGHKPDILEPAVRTGRFDTVQVPFSPLEQQAADLLKLAREFSMGTIAMKPLAGGALTAARAAIDWLRVNPLIDVAIPGMESAEQVQENCSIFTRTVSAQEKEELAELVSGLGSNFCRRCEYCQPCPRGLKIPAMFLFEGYYTRYNLKEWARERYHTLPVKASECDECGICESKCPYDLPIREMLKQTAATLED